MQKQSLLLLLLCCGLFGVAMAQEVPGRAAALIPVDETYATLGKTSLFRQYYHLRKNDELRPLRAEHDDLGFTHEKFQQYYKGVPVEGATVTVHSRGGKVATLSGDYLTLGELNTTPAITAAAAFEAAKAYVGAKHYRWEEPLGEHNNYAQPKGELVVSVDFGGREPARLAYKFDIYATEPLYRAYVFIDARTGKFLRENKRIHEVDVTATGPSLYNGNVSFKAEFINGSYRLRQTTSGGGVQTFDIHHSSNTSAATDITSATTNFTGDAAGVSAHWCAEKVYDYYLTRHGRNSYDDNGAVLKSYVHYLNNLVNAYWTGSEMLYGDGNAGQGVSPLVTLDICGHEMTHAVTEYSANLVYANESGALNESFSDIFGETVENFAQGTNDWLLATQIGITIRSFINPNAYDQPDTYHGTDWDPSQEVHTNSGVQNKWFYILSVGETGTNDNGHHYCVTGIGMTNAAKIAYRNLTVYLSSGSNYAAARTGAIQSAIDLFGADSPEVVATTNAWRAVGVGAAFVPKAKCPTNIVRNNTLNQCAATNVTYAAATGLANCPTVTLLSGPASGSSFPVGTTTVTYKVTDTDGTTATCAFTVQVNDTQAPTIGCPANTTVAANASCQGTLASYVSVATTNDNCPSVNVTQLPTVGATLSPGASTVTLRATDAANLSSSCTFTVTVTDQTPPAITCPGNTTVAANASCQAALPTLSAASVSDNCSTPTVTQIPAAGTLFSGPLTVTLRATDGAALTSTCSASVTIVDQTPPSITCPANTTVAANSSCQASLSSFNATTAFSDNCSTPTLSQSPVTGTLVSGATTITMQATDAANLSSSCTFTVTVADQTPPTINCPANTTVTANANCQASLASFNSTTTFSDNCSTPTLSQTPAAGTLVSGATTVTMWATDAANLSSSCTLTVTVVDQTAPNILCPANTTVAANASCQASLASYAASATATDNCGAPTVAQTPAPATVLNLGASTITLRATDAAGLSSSCILTVTVTDQTPPSITCPANTTVAANASCQASLASYIASATASDNCSTPVKTQLPAAGTTLGVGSTTVTMRATDAVNLSSTCTFTVQVIDQIPPTVTCKSVNVALNAAGSATITTGDVFQSGADNCGTVNQVSVVPATFNCNQVGLNTVVLTVNDGNGNTATCTTQAKVFDAILPTMLCKNVTVSLDAGGNATVTPAQVNNGSFDNCGIGSLTLSKTAFTCANIGANTVTLTGKDLTGNQATCQATVTVNDAIAPLALCKNVTVQLGANGSVALTGATVNNGSSDNCNFTMTVTPATLGCANVGANTVTLKVTDAGSNMATCTAVVTVQDKLAPNALCKNINVFLNENGQASITAADVNNGSTDNCTIASTTINVTQFNCSNLPGSPVPVQLTVKDVYNNQSTCVAYVTVKESIAPTPVCENVTVPLNAQGKATVYGASLAANSYDNCAVTSYAPVAKVYTAANLGVNNLAITVKDWSGNAATCVSQVTVVPYNSNQSLQQSGGNHTGFAATDLTLRLAPNPANAEVTLTFDLPTEQPYRLRLFDLMGRLVLHQDGAGAAGFNTLPVQVGALAPGVYVVDLQSAEGKAVRRLVVER